MNSVSVFRILFSLIISLTAAGVSAGAEAPLTSGEAGYTTGKDCEILRFKVAEDFLAKNEDFFGLRGPRVMLTVIETASGPGSLNIESAWSVRFEQQNGVARETYNLHFRGRKNFDCDDFRASDVELEFVSFRLQ